MGHSPKSPSGFAAIRACAGKVRMCKGLPNKDNVYAARGTAAHALGEECLLKGTQPSDYLGQKFGEFTHPDGRVEEFLADGEMCDAVEIYVDYCRSIMEGKFMVETRFELPFIGKGEKGTADFVSLESSTAILHVVDYKNGFGIVDAFQNIQELCYGLGAEKAFESEEWDTLRLTIVQPNAFHHQGAVRYWDVPRDELLDWKLDLAAASVAADDPNAPLTPGSHCTYCEARFTCPARAKLNLEGLRMDIKNPNSKPVDMALLTDAEVIDLVFNRIPDIMKWCGDLKDYAQRRAEEKNPLPGSKLVETRAVRSWADPLKAEYIFAKTEGAFDKKFKSAPQMEKLLGKKRFAEFEHLVKKISTGVTLVPDTDPRPSARASGASEFGAVDTNINLFG